MQEVDGRHCAEQYMSTTLTAQESFDDAAPNVFNDDRIDDDESRGHESTGSIKKMRVSDSNVRSFTHATNVRSLNGKSQLDDEYVMLSE